MIFSPSHKGIGDESFNVNMDFLRGLIKPVESNFLGYYTGLVNLRALAL